MDLGNKVRNICIEKKISIISLAGQLGMSQQNLYDRFKKESIETKHLEKIAKILGVSITYFFDEDIQGKVIINGNGNKGIIGNNNYSHNNNDLKEIENLKSQIEILKSQIEDKESIIELKNEKIESLTKQLKNENKI